MKSDDGKYSYIWLTSTLLNFKHLVSLSNFLELKKQLIIFVETEVIPALIVKAQEGESDLIIEICKEIAQRAATNESNLYTLEFLVQKMVDPGEDYPVDQKPILKIDDFKLIFTTLVADTAKILYE